MAEIPDPLVEERAKSAWNRAYYGSRGAPEGVTNWDRQPAKLREARRQAVRDDLGPVWESAYRAGREDESQDALIIQGDLDITTVVASLDRAESEGGDLGRAAGDLLRRLPTWMGSDGHYRPAGPGQAKERPRKLLGAGNLGTCPTCSERIGRAAPEWDKIEVPSDGTYRRFEPSPLTLTLKPCGHRFFDREAQELAREIHRRIGLGEDQDTPEGREDHDD